MINQFLLVFLGGGLGSCLRFGLSTYFSKFESSFPWATMISNILACFILGLCLSILIDPKYNHHKLLLAAGFCGGFSTFSTFIGEDYTMISDGSFIKFILYTTLSIVVGLIFFTIGMKIGVKN